MKALPPPAQNRASALVGHPIQLSPQKTPARPEARGKKSHSYKPLQKEFRRDGFHHRQIVRGRGAAIYEKTWLGCTESSPSYEVVRIRRREGFQIGNRFVGAGEIYPNSEASGFASFTFINWNKAWAKFFEISLEEPAKTRRR